MKIDNPAEFGYFADSAGGCPYPGNANSYWGWRSAGWNLCGNVSSRHNDGTNVAFVDGHVKWLGQSKLGPGTTVWTAVWK